MDLLFYVPSPDGLPETGPEALREQLESVLASAPDVVLEGRPGDAYRPGLWRDAATGASCQIDLGEPPIEPDTLHPPTAYPGWHAAPLTLHVGVQGPHWHCVALFPFIEHLLAALPGLAILDSEDTGIGDQRGPGPWSRPRLLASWERQHAVSMAGRTGVLRMARLASICLWRYRSERRQGQAAHPDLVWPEAVALHDRSGGVARSAALVTRPDPPWVLPPVELLVRPAGTGALGASGLRVVEMGAAEAQLAAATRPLGFGRALLWPAHAASPAPWDGLPPVASERFVVLGDGDWSD
jgi:hypothetical protein